MTLMTSSENTTGFPHEICHASGRSRARVPAWSGGGGGKPETALMHALEMDWTRAVMEEGATAKGRNEGEGRKRQGMFLADGVTTAGRRDNREGEEGGHGGRKDRGGRWGSGAGCREGHKLLWWRREGREQRWGGGRGGSCRSQIGGPS